MKKYDISKGHLILEHDFPRHQQQQQQQQQNSIEKLADTDADAKIKIPKCNSVSVDVNSILGSLKSDDLCVGAWLNVVGYVKHQNHQVQNQNQNQFQNEHRRQRKVQRGKVSSNTDMKHDSNHQISSVCVDAIMVFSAGPIEISEYERVISDLLAFEHSGLSA